VLVWKKRSDWLRKCGGALAKQKSASVPCGEREEIKVLRREKAKEAKEAKKALRESGTG